MMEERKRKSAELGARRASARAGTECGGVYEEGPRPTSSTVDSLQDCPSPSLHRLRKRVRCEEL